MLKSPQMDIQQHARTAQIKKLSRSLCTFLTWIGILIWFLWPLVLVPLFADVRLSPGARNVGPGLQLGVLSLPVRIAMMVGIALFIYFVQQTVLHARMLMLHFSQGEIFNVEAVKSARSALSNALVVFWLNVACQIAVMFLQASHAAHPVYRINPESLIYGFLFFGLMYVLLWALEIGRDLNEESVLTV